MGARARLESLLKTAYKQTLSMVVVADPRGLQKGHHSVRSGCTLTPLSLSLYRWSNKYPATIPQ